jgi:large subunit ribosomal protein L33
MAKHTQSQYLRLISTAKVEKTDPKTGATSMQPTGYFYVTKRNPKTAAEQGKFEMNKYDPIARQHVAFKEAKMK